MKLLAIIILFLFTGCNLENRPSEKNVAYLYVDILVAEETYKTDIDSMNIAIDSLYDEYNISKEVYLKTLSEYKFNEKTWDEFFAVAQDYLDTLKAVESRK